MTPAKGATKPRPQPEPLHVFDAIAEQCGIDVDALLAEVANEIAKPRGGAE